MRSISWPLNLLAFRAEVRLDPESGGSGGVALRRAIAARAGSAVTGLCTASRFKLKLTDARYWRQEAAASPGRFFSISQSANRVMERVVGASAAIASAPSCL